MVTYTILLISGLMITNPIILINGLMVTYTILLISGLMGEWEESRSQFVSFKRK